MKSVICFLVSINLLFVVNAQSPTIDSNLLSQFSNEEAIKSMEMIKNLNEKGITISGDSIITSVEFKHLIKDINYFNKVYPDTYTWEKTVYFIKIKELKIAFWFLINLYPLSDYNKELVLKTVLTYDQLLKMDEVLINTFYTYSFIDPNISVIKNGKPEIIRPDILEYKLNNVREIVTYIEFYRLEKEK